MFDFLFSRVFIFSENLLFFEQCVDETALGKTLYFRHFPVFNTPGLVYANNLSFFY